MIRPRNDWLVVKMPEAQVKTKGGLYLPEILRETSPPMEGIVLDAGRIALDYLEAHEAGIGCRVQFEQYAGLEEHDPDMGNVLLMRTKDLLAVLEI